MNLSEDIRETWPHTYGMSWKKDSKAKDIGRAPMNRVIASLVRHRPRDIVKLCNGAAVYAKKNNHSKSLTGDLEATFESYSHERRQDLVNEFKTELNMIHALLLEMKPSVRQQKERRMWQYKNDELVRKLREAMDHHNFMFASRIATTPKSLAAFLYKVEFITARKESNGKIERRFFDQNRYLQNQFTDFGWDWEVHPAYRWALNPSGHDMWAELESGDT